MTQRLLFTLSIAFSLSGCTAIVDNNLQTAECLTNADCPTTNPCEGTPVVRRNDAHVRHRARDRAELQRW